MARYEFLTSWFVDAPIERVFEVLNDSAAFPDWWKGVTAVEMLEPADGGGVGELARYSWRSVLPYTLTFDSRVTRVEPPYLIEGHATGELEGIGVCRLFRRPGRHRSALQLAGAHDEAVDERVGPAGATRVPVEPRSRHAAGRRRAGGAAGRVTAPARLGRSR